MGYFTHTVKGVTWIGALRVFTRAISYGRTALIARILSPTQFGIYGIASLVLSLLEILTETGINVFLVQNEEKVERFINAAWLISIIRGVVISILIFLFSGLVADFFNVTDVKPLIVLISIVPLIRGFINPSIVKFQKNLEFQKEFYYRSVIFLVESAVSVALVIFTLSPIALIWGLVAGAIFEVGISFIFVRPVPKLFFEFSSVKQIFKKGKWMTLTGIFAYFFHNGDNIVVGKILGAGSLGIYDMAYKLSILPITEVAAVISQVTFPVYVRIGQDKKRLRRAFGRTLLLVSTISLPIGAIFILFSREIVLTILGPKWTSSIQILQVLAIFGVIRAITSCANAVFLALKRQEYVTIITLSGLIALSLIIVPFIRIFGLIGVGLAVTVATVATIPFVLYYLWIVFRD